MIDVTSTLSKLTHGGAAHSTAHAQIARKRSMLPRAESAAWPNRHESKCSRCGSRCDRDRDRCEPLRRPCSRSSHERQTSNKKPNPQRHCNKHHRTLNEDDNSSRSGEWQMKIYRSRVCQNAGCCELAHVLANAATQRQVNAPSDGRLSRSTVRLRAGDHPGQKRGCLDGCPKLLGD